MADLKTLQAVLQQHVGQWLTHIDTQNNEITIEAAPADLKPLAQQLRDQSALKFDCLVDLCGVDYLHYGLDEWATDDATSTGFERGVSRLAAVTENPHWQKPRFAVVYHLLSVEHNHRLRLRVFVDDDTPLVETVTDIWASANWYEREAFDLYGILFENHPDLRRILTDYGFVGHPFRKDFPLIGEVAMRYDAHHGRVIYEPVDIEPRTLVPKTIRKGQREVDA